MQLDTITLPSNLYWSNEFGFKSIVQSAERSVAGGMVIDFAPLAYGQKITLTGAWATRAEVLALRDLEDAGDTVRTLTLNDGTTQYSVLFDLSVGGVAAELISPELNPTAETYYELTLNLLTVEPV